MRKLRPSNLLKVTWLSDYHQVSEIWTTFSLTLEPLSFFFPWLYFIISLLLRLFTSMVSNQSVAPLLESSRGCWSSSLTAGICYTEPMPVRSWRAFHSHAECSANNQRNLSQRRDIWERGLLRDHSEGGHRVGSAFSGCEGRGGAQVSLRGLTSLSHPSWKPSVWKGPEPWLHLLFCPATSAAPVFTFNSQWWRGALSSYPLSQSNLCPSPSQDYLSFMFWGEVDTSYVSTPAWSVPGSAPALSSQCGYLFSATGTPYSLYSPQEYYPNTVCLAASLQG